VCRTLDRMGMPMESMDLLGLWIESGSGLYMVLSIFVISYVTYDWVHYDVVYESLKCFVDGCMLTIDF
jgi:hypothetical protein